jgi:hypothetical protein
MDVGMTEVVAIAAVAALIAFAILFKLMWRTRGTAEADIVRTRGTAEADAVKARGLAEAEAVRARGLSEAAAIEARSQALAENQEAVIGQQLAERWPDIVAARGRARVRGRRPHGGDERRDRHRGAHLAGDDPGRGRPASGAERPRGYRRRGERVRRSGIE